MSKGCYRSKRQRAQKVELKKLAAKKKFDAWQTYVAERDEISVRLADVKYHAAVEETESVSSYKRAKRVRNNAVYDFYSISYPSQSEIARYNAQRDSFSYAWEKHYNEMKAISKRLYDANKAAVAGKKKAWRKYVTERYDARMMISGKI